MGVLSRIGWVTGLAAEARLLRGFDAVSVGGGMPAGAAEAAARLADAGVAGLVSFGLAGGLDPELAPGAVVVPAAVVEGRAVFAADAVLCAALGGVSHGAVLAGDAVVAAAGAKAALFAASGAVAVDLESGAVARVAAARGLPFAVLRSVCDPAGRDLPPAALAALDGAGAIGFGRVLASVLARPWQVPALLGLARDAAAARAALAGRLVSLGANSH